MPEAEMAFPPNSTNYLHNEKRPEHYASDLRFSGRVDKI